MTPRMRDNFKTIAWHSDYPWGALLKFCRYAARRGRITEDDAAEIHDIVQAEVDKMYGRTEPPASNLGRMTRIVRIKQAINSGSK